MSSTPRLPVLSAILLSLAKLLPEYNSGLLGLLPLYLRRRILQEHNLRKAPFPPPTSDDVPDHRTADASGNDPQNYMTGAANTAFGRNMAPDDRRRHLDMPPVQLVAASLLERDRFKPAGDQLNVLAAAWIQAMTHDWFGHLRTEQVVELSSATAQCPLRSFRFNASKREADGTFTNTRTHWWDASFVYGQDEAAVHRARTHVGGKLHQSNTPGILPKADDGTPLVGDTQDGWMGVTLLQDLFLREHNVVAEKIAELHPEYRDDDEKLFNVARLVVSAVAAKIHTVDWTVELLKTDTLELGMKTNWYGLPRALGLSDKPPPGLLGLVGQKESENHGVPFCLTEEFVSVYRMHALLPDGLPLPSGFVPLSELVGLKGDQVLSSADGAEAAWDSIVSYPCGNIELFNYPRALRDLAPTDELGRALPEHVDLAALDLYRDRERGVRNYNDFRRALHMKAFKSIAELTGPNKRYHDALSEVYGEDGIEKVDLMVGLYAEKKIDGFAISETAFLIFLLMASRRLEADRFFTTDFTEQTYTKAGLMWVRGVSGMRDVLRRHWPDVERQIPGGYSAFKPRKQWAAEQL